MRDGEHVCRSVEGATGVGREQKDPKDTSKYRTGSCAYCLVGSL